ncbi:unnamed protein product, partial [Adineta steineri]
ETFRDKSDGNTYNKGSKYNGKKSNANRFRPPAQLAKHVQQNTNHQQQQQQQQQQQPPPSLW